MPQFPGTTRTRFAGRILKIVIFPIKSGPLVLRLLAQPLKTLPELVMSKNWIALKTRAFAGGLENVIPTLRGDFWHRNATLHAGQE
jgi:hypothetical protein